VVNALPIISTRERRARLGVRHRLAPGTQAAEPAEVAESLVALHATDPATVHLSVLARMDAGDVARTEKALYEQRSLVRLLGMRRSMFVVPLDVAPVVQAACSQAVAAAQRRLLVKHLTAAGVGPDPGAWLADVEESVVAALRARGTATAALLAQDEPRLRTTLQMAEGKNYAASVNITSRVLFQLGADARIVRGRPRGSWISSQYVWSPMETWLDGGLPELAKDEAQAELIRRWLGAFGPAPVSDITWWTGLGLRDVRRALARLAVLDVDLGEGQTGVVLPGDAEDAGSGQAAGSLGGGDKPGDWAALLPGLDPTAMGWQRRDWYVGEHAARVTDRTGNIGATVWWQGRVVGGWGQRAGGEIVFGLLEDIGAAGRSAVEDAAARLAQGLRGVRVTPRFPAPLDRELRA
jgi:hypothetical protein